MRSRTSPSFRFRSKVTGAAFNRPPKTSPVNLVTRKTPSSTVYEPSSASTATSFPSTGSTMALLFICPRKRKSFRKPEFAAPRYIASPCKTISPFGMASLLRAHRKSVAEIRPE